MDRLEMKWTQVFFSLSLTLSGVYSKGVVYSDTTVTIHPQWLAQGGNASYDNNRCNKHFGLDQTNLIPNCRRLRTDSGRFPGPENTSYLIKKWPEDPNRSGYPDPNYLRNVSREQELCPGYLENINTGYENDMIMVAGALEYPSWVDTSEHDGHFPNNVDVAAEFMMLLMQGVYDCTKGRIPPYLEPINEPSYEWAILNFTTITTFHKLVAEKLHARFNIRVAGPTIRSYIMYADLNDFSYWDKVADFMDGTLGYIDVFSFHAYNNLVVSGRSHNFTGANEARLVAFIDLVENYASQKTGKMIPLVISEYGRDGVSGLDKYAPSPIIDFSTIYQSNGHKFTQLGLREYIDRAVVFLEASEERPGRYSLNYSLFSPDGKPTRIVDFFEFWYKFRSGFSFIKTTSQYDGKERTVSPLAMSSSSTNETVILLHSYSRRSQAVKLVFQGDWIKPTTGQATCTTIKDDWFPVITFNETIDIQKTQGTVELPPEATCHFTFNTPSNKLPSFTINETTFYGADTLIPIKGNVVSTVISLPNGQYDSARLRVSTSWLINETNSVSYLTFNLHRLDSFIKLYDSDKFNPASNTYWNVWEFEAPVTVFVPGPNQVQVHLSNSMGTGYVSSVALVTGKLVPSDLWSL
ncbi:beta-porphyranase A-like isoform X2 [Haliotis rubra]|uniref:beta-porphyranase A-like isoform X2 n=1 Tax=Haliotis rubra TaxID=36100 RepID=UPI001EE544FE|nr:beta-porphyranase A-like isoform X2 [Haliotis rubra]